MGICGSCDSNHIRYLIGKSLIHDFIVDRYFGIFGIRECINSFLFDYEQVIDELDVYEYLRDTNKLNYERDLKLLLKGLKNTKNIRHSLKQFERIVSGFDVHTLYMAIPYYHLVIPSNGIFIYFASIYILKMNPVVTEYEISRNSRDLTSLCKICSSFKICEIDRKLLSIKKVKNQRYSNENRTTKIKHRIVFKCDFCEHQEIKIVKNIM
jgi:hypothetical protein